MSKEIEQNKEENENLPTVMVVTLPLPVSVLRVF